MDDMATIRAAVGYLMVKMLHVDGKAESKAERGPRELFDIMS